MFLYIKLQRSTSGRNLEVQVFACGVVIPLIHSVLFRPFTAVTQMFVALGCGDAFRPVSYTHLDVYKRQYEASAIQTRAISSTNALIDFDNVPSCGDGEHA